MTAKYVVTLDLRDMNVVANLCVEDVKVPGGARAGRRCLLVRQGDRATRDDRKSSDFRRPGVTWLTAPAVGGDRTDFWAPQSPSPRSLSARNEFWDKDYN